MWGRESCLQQPPFRRLAGVACALSLLVSAAALSQTQPSPVAAARKSLDLLLAEKYADVAAMAAPSAKATLTPEFLRDRAGAEIKSFGKLGPIGAAVTANDGTY